MVYHLYLAQHFVYSGITFGLFNFQRLILCLLHPGEMEEEMENSEMVDLPEKQKHQLRHRELFLSRQLESLPATHIRYSLNN